MILFAFAQLRFFSYIIRVLCRTSENLLNPEIPLEIAATSNNIFLLKVVQNII